MSDSSPSFFEKLNAKLKSSISVRIFFIAVLSLLLLIPAGLVEDMVREREWRKNDAIAEINQSWGNAQTVSGPFLSIPYRYESKNSDGDMVRYRSTFHVLPETLRIDGELIPEKRNISLFESVVYRSNMELHGHFLAPDLEELGIPVDDVIWDEASIELGISDMRGIKNKLDIQWQGQRWNMEPGTSTKQVVVAGVSARVALAPDSLGNMEFNVDLELNGSERLYFMPLGGITEVHFDSPWPHPRFNGAFLPEHDISEEGFSADWKVLNLNRNYPQQWKGQDFNPSESTFGIEFITPVEDYQKTIRSLKYALMTIAFTFLIFFFVEIRSGKRVHPIQFILVGLAIVVFYTMLVSMAEHIGFNAAYGISAVAVMFLIAVYFQAIFKQVRMTSFLIGVLFLLYGFVFTTLQLQDYALLIGSLGLFLVLALVMVLTRKVDWYALKSDSGDPIDQH